MPAGYAVTHMALPANIPFSTASKGEENCGDCSEDKRPFPSLPPTLCSHLLVFIQPLSVMLFNHGQQHRHQPIGYSSRSFATQSHNDGRKATDAFPLLSPPHGLSSRHSSRDPLSRSHSQLPPDVRTDRPSYLWPSAGLNDRKKSRLYNRERRARGPLVPEESLLSPAESGLHSAGDTMPVKRRRSRVPPGLLYVFDLQTGMPVSPVTEIPLLPGSSVALCQWARVDFGSLLNGSDLAREELAGRSTESLEKNRCGTPNKTTSSTEDARNLNKCIVLLTTCAQLYVFTAPAVFYSRHHLTSEEDDPERKEMFTTLRRNTSGTPETRPLSHSKPRMDVSPRQGRRSGSVSGQGHCSKGELLSSVPAFCQPLVLLRKANLASTCRRAGTCDTTDLHRDGHVALPPFCRSSENNRDCSKLSYNEVGLGGSCPWPDSIVWVEIQPRCLWLDSLLGLPRGVLSGSALTQKGMQMEKIVSGNAFETHSSPQGNKGAKERVTARPSFAAASCYEEELSANSELQELCEKMGFPFRQAWLQVIVGCTSGKVWVSSPPRRSVFSFQRKGVTLQSDHGCSAPSEFSWSARRNGLESGIFGGVSEGVCTEESGINERNVFSGLLSSFLDPCQYSGEHFVRIDELPFQDSDFFSLLDWSQLGRRVLKAPGHAHSLPPACTPESSSVSGYVGGAPPRQDEEKTTSTRAHDCPADNEVRCEDGEIHPPLPGSGGTESFRERSLSRSPLERLELQRQQDGVSLVSSCLRSVSDSGVVKPRSLEKRQAVACTPSASEKPFEPRPLRVLQKRMVLAGACGSTGRSLMRSVFIDLSEPAKMRLLRKARSGSRLSSVLNTAAAVALAGSGAACNYGDILWGHSPVLVNGGGAMTPTGQAEDFSYHGSLCRQQLEERPIDTCPSVPNAGCLSGGGSWSMAGKTNLEPTSFATGQETRSCLPLTGGVNAISRDCSSKEQRDDERLRVRGNAHGNHGCEPGKQQTSSPAGECGGGFSHSAVETTIQLREVDQKLQRNQQILLNFLIDGRVLGPEFARLLNTTPTALRNMRLQVCEELSRRLQEIAETEENEEARSDGNPREETLVLQKKASEGCDHRTELNREANALHTPPQHPAVESHHGNANEGGGGPECEVAITAGGSEPEGEQRERENRGEVSSIEEGERNEREETPGVTDERRATGAKGEGVATMTEGVRQGEDDEEAIEVVTIDSEEDDIQEEESSKAKGDTDEEEADEEETQEQGFRLETDDEQPLQTSGGQRLTLQHLEHQVSCSTLRSVTRAFSPDRALCQAGVSLVRERDKPR